MIIRRLPFLFFIFLAASFLSWAAEGNRQDAGKASGASEASANPVVARVLGESITERQMVDTINQIVVQLVNSQQAGEQQLLRKDALYYKEALDTLVGTILLKDEARQKKLVADKDKVEQTFQSLKGQFPAGEKFQEALKAQGMTEADLRDSIETNILSQMVLEGVAKSVPPPTDADIRKFYDDNPKYFVEAGQIHAAQIWLKAEDGASSAAKSLIRDKLARLKADIEGGKVTFAEAASKFSDDKITGSKGGDLGYLKPGTLAKPMEDALSAAKTGSLTPVLESDAGFYLFQVIDSKPAVKTPLESVQAKIKDFLAGKARQEATKQHIADLKSKVKIEILISEEEWIKRHTAKTN